MSKIFKHGTMRRADIQEMGVGAYIARLETDLTAALKQIETLTAQLALAHSGAFDRPLAAYPFARQLTATELRIMGGLMACYPRTAGHYDLAEIMSGDHAKDPTLNNLKVVVTHLRSKLGKDAVQNVWGQGYMLGADFYEREITPYNKKNP